MTEKSLGLDQEDARLLPRLSTTKSTAQITSVGRELDALIDERVFGHVVAWRNGFSWRADIVTGVMASAPGYDLTAETRLAGAWVPEYSTSIADAWKVIEGVDATRGHFDGQHVSWTLERGPGPGNGDEPGDGYRKSGNVGGWSASFYTYEYDWISARADTAPLAICLAALRALNV